MSWEFAENAREAVVVVFEEESGDIMCQLNGREREKNRRIDMKSVSFSSEKIGAILAKPKTQIID